MIDVALVSVIRRWHHREGLSVRKIARRTGLSRNTVRKYLASEVVEPRYPDRKGPSKLDDYEQTLISWLHRESKRHRKQRRNIKHLYQGPGRGICAAVAGAVSGSRAHRRQPYVCAAAVLCRRGVPV